jgi:hypothetical protein
MGTQVQEKEAFELPTVNPWRRPPAPPSREQIRFAMDLCRTELPYAERTATIRTFSVLDGAAVSELIARLKDVRAKRLARLRRSRRRR